MRLVYVSNSRIPTGKAHGLQIMYMCEHFASQGAEVELVVPSKRNFLQKDPFEYYGVKRNFHIRTLTVPDLASKTMRLPRGIFFLDICFYLLALSVAKIAAPDRLIYTRDYPLLFLFSPLHNTIVLEVHDIPRHFLFRWALKRATHFVAISKGVKDALVALGISASRIIVAHDAVNLEEFAHPISKSDARKHLQLPPEKKIAMYIGRIDQWKGTDVLFEAATFLPDDIQVVVIGGEKAQIETLQKQHPNIVFIGPRPYRELADNQAAADVLILPNSGKYEISAKYTSPLKLFAYMTTSGTAIVASDLPSIREILDEKSSYLTPPDDPRALAQMIQTALSHQEESRKKAQIAYERVQRYTWSARAKEILEHIRR